jgi:hypothetical protein
LPSDVQQALSEALGVGFGIRGNHMLDVRTSLEPMWRTMAQDSHGRIDSRALRYLVHRYFLQRYHISIIGMEALQVSSSSSAAEVDLIAELAPKLIRGLLEGTSEELGYSLEDTAALVAVIERLVEDSGHDQVEEAYNARGFEITDTLTRDQLMDVMKHYVVRWMNGRNEKRIAEYEVNRTVFEQIMQRPNWQKLLADAKGHILALEHHRTKALVSGQAHGSGLKESWNPMRPLFSFADVQAVVSDLIGQFGRSFEPACEDLTQVLVKHSRHNTGRVPLSDFYAAALAGQWHFSESPEYLRHLGVLEEASWFHEPQVILANYMQSANSCVITQKHFRVCCRSPCQDFYSDLEMAIGTPEAEPEVVLAIVSNFTFGLDDASPRVTKKLRSQLQEIAQANHGRIPLHGRLFAQWLHFVFPSECPFPHRSGSTIGLSPREFESYGATVEEMKAIVRQGRERASADRPKEAGEQRQHDEDHSDYLMDLWSQEEELLSNHLQQGHRATFSLQSVLRPILYGFAAISVFVIVVLQPAKQAMGAAEECGFSLAVPFGRHKEAKIPALTKSHYV